MTIHSVRIERAKRKRIRKKGGAGKRGMRWEGEERRRVAEPCASK